MNTKHYRQYLDEANSMDIAELVGELRAVLGARAVAYLASEQNSQITRDWAEGLSAPVELVAQRLRLAYRAVRVIGERDDVRLAAAWMAGLNPTLYDHAAATLIREGDPSIIGDEIIGAALHLG